MQTKGTSRKNRTVAGASKLMLYFGIAVLIFSLLYMVNHLDKADTTIHIWLPFMIAGVVLVAISLLLGMVRKLFCTNFIPYK